MMNWSTVHGIVTGQTYLIHKPLLIFLFFPFLIRGVGGGVCHSLASTSLINFLFHLQWPSIRDCSHQCSHVLFPVVIPSQPWSSSSLSACPFCFPHPVWPIPFPSHSVSHYFPILTFSHSNLLSFSSSLCYPLVLLYIFFATCRFLVFGIGIGNLYWPNKIYIKQCSYKITYNSSYKIVLH